MHSKQHSSTVPSAGMTRRSGHTTKEPLLPQKHSLDGGANLELSMHVPAEPFGNRYDALRHLSRVPEKKLSCNTSASNRRPCSSRKAKDRKRARNTRRKKCKWSAVDILDEQLSLDFDRILKAANIPPPSPSVPTASDARPKCSAPMPTPQQLPYFNFGGLDLMDQMPVITAQKVEPIRDLRISPQLPSWCPKLPAFVNNDMKINGFPLFFDLSQMPEPEDSRMTSSKSHQMQLWRVKPSPQPRKQSLFFPPLHNPTANTRPAPTESTPYGPHPNIEDVVSPSSFFIAQKADTFDSPSHKPRKSKQINAYAANLWGLLAPADIEVRNSEDDSYAGGLTFIPRREILAAPYGPFDHRLESVGMPVELDSFEIPFVHNNSLTGFANEQDAYDAVVFGHKTPMLGPMAHPINLPPMGLNDLVVDQFDELEDESYLPDLSTLPALPLTPTPESALPIFPAYIPATHEEEFRNEDVGKTRTQPVYSIEDITPPRSPTLRPADEDIVDVAYYIATGHSLDCWCTFCEGPPELIEPESWINDDEWSTTSTGEASQASSKCSAWESEWGTFVEAATWEDDEWAFEGDVSGLKPSSVAHGPW